MWSMTQMYVFVCVGQCLCCYKVNMYKCFYRTTIITKFYDKRDFIKNPLCYINHCSVQLVYWLVSFVSLNSLFFSLSMFKGLRDFNIP